MAPALLLLIWTGIYARNCLITLTAPGRPVVFRYKAPAGEVTLHAESFVVNVRQGWVYVLKPELVDPSGIRVASAEFLELSNLDWRKGSNQFIDLRIHNLQGRLVRLPGGAFQIVDLIPPRTKPTVKNPLRVLVEGATVTLEDQQGTTWRQVATTKRVEVEGFGQDWIAHATVDLPGMGSVRGQVQYVPDTGIHIFGSTQGINAQAVVMHLLTTPAAKKYASLRDLRVEDLTVSGPFDLFVPASKKAVLQASAHVEAQGAAYGAYRVDDLSFDGIITSKGAQGRAVGRAGGVSATFDGTGTWSPSEAAAGTVQAAAPSIASIPSWARRWIPSKLAVSEAKYQGWISFGKNKETELSGTASADRVDYGQVHLADVSAIARGDRARLRLDSLHGVMARTDASGALDLDLIHRTLTGWVHADSPDLSAVAKLAKVEGVSGEGHVDAELSGPIKTPSVRFVASGDVGIRRVGGADLGRQSVDLAGTYANGAAVIERGSIEGGIGLLAISGKGEPKGAGISMHVEGRGLQPGSLVPGLSGSFDLAADLAGSFSNPHYSGRIEGSDLSYKRQTVNAAEVEFRGDRRAVEATKVAAVSGTMDLLGTGRFAMASGQLSGRFGLRGIPATQYLGDRFAGIFDVPDIQLSGTLKNPIATGQVEGNELVAQDVVLRTLQGHVRADRNGVQLDHASAAVAGGQVSGSGSYAFRDGKAEFAASADHLDLGRLAPALGETVAISGSTSISRAQGTLAGKSVTGSAQGTLDGVQINGVPAGDGNWTLTDDGSQLHATVSIGELQPQLRVLNADVGYNLQAKTLTGTLDASKARMKDLIGAASRYLPASWTADPENLQAITGDLTFDAKLAGPAKDPNVSFGALQAQNLTFRGVPYGTLTAPGVTRDARKWTVPNLTLSGPQAAISAQGTIEEDGRIDLKGGVDQMHLSAFSPWAESLASSNGLATAQFSVSGFTKSPDITGSASVTHLAKAPQTPGAASKPADDLSVQVPQFTLDGTTVGLAGSYAYAGFSGSFSASAPFSYNGGLGSGSVSGGISVNDRSITEIPFLSAYLDPARTSGTIGGSISVSGPSDSLAYSGGLTLQAKSLGVRFPDTEAYVRRIDDTIQGLNASLQITNQHTLQLNATGKVERGGSFALNASTPMVDLSGLLTGSVDPMIRQFLDGPLAGRLSLDHTALRQSAPGGYVAAEVEGSAVLAGTVAKPAIGTQTSHGTFTITSLDTVMPTLPAAGGEGSVPLIDPSFYVDAKLANAARIRSATADLNLTGNGLLRGVLSDPRGTADLIVSSGSIRLPGGIVRLDEGGTVTFRYRHPFGETPVASLDVDLQGHTSLTAIRYGGNSQRYDVLLELRGDLLKDEGLQMEAFSNPPDLTSQEALAQLGALGYLQGMSTTQGGYGEAQQRITQALAGFAIPAVTDPLTQSLARSLGLSYLTFEYNGFEQTTIDVGRALTNNLSIQYRGQIGEPAAGLRPIQDFRLVLTPFQKSPTLRNFSFSLGSDQVSPWKIAVEYGVRFGGPKGPPSTKKTRISP